MKRFVINRTIAFCAYAFALLFSGCNFNLASDMYYMGKTKSPTNPTEPGDIPSLPTDPVGTDDPFNSTADWNKDDYQFNKTMLDEWYFHADFDSNTVPSYAFRKDDGHSEWKRADTTKNEWTSTSPNNENKAQTYGIIDMTVHCYRGKNPLVKPDSPYNAADGRMPRFYFYYIDGKVNVPLVNVVLNQHLIAVDTRSKFIFSYGKVKNVTEIFGNKMPTSFEPVDAVPADRGATTGETRPFYQYDPIGFVKNDGTVVLYARYQTEMADSVNGRTNYFPQIHSLAETVAQQTDTNAHGHSPYFVSGETPKPPIIETSFKNRVSGNTYTKWSGFLPTAKYYFSGDGSTVTWTDGLSWVTYGTYTFYKERDDRSAIYKRDDTEKEYWGLHVSDNEGKADAKLTWTKEPASEPDDVSTTYDGDSGTL